MTHINLISNYEDVQAYLHALLTNISVGDFGHENNRLNKLPKVYEDLQKWEAANVEYLQDPQKEIFFSQKLGLEKVMEQFKINTEVKF